MNKYNFDNIIDRTNTFCVKYDNTYETSLPKDIINLSIADMDFGCSKPIKKALMNRIEKDIFGYTVWDTKEYLNAIINWFEKNHDWKINKNDIYTSTNVLSGIKLLISILTKENDGILIQPPVYSPFKDIIKSYKRKVIENPLININGKYQIDFDDFEKKVSDESVKGMILCNPHNPVGRIWDIEELQKINEICIKYNKWVISDEIHCDLTRVNKNYIPYDKACNYKNNNIYICTSATKTFNIAGLSIANIIIKNEYTKKLWKETEKSKIGNIFAIESVIAGYNDSKSWLEEVKAYIDSNIDYTIAFFEKYFPEAIITYPEATYLIWVDFNEYIDSADSLEKRMKDSAKLYLDFGSKFGKEGKGFFRINVATPKKILEEAYNRILNEFITN